MSTPRWRWLGLEKCIPHGGVAPLEGVDEGQQPLGLHERDLNEHRMQHGRVEEPHVDLATLARLDLRAIVRNGTRKLAPFPLRPAHRKGEHPEGRRAHLVSYQVGDQAARERGDVHAGHERPDVVGGYERPHESEVLAHTARAVDVVEKHALALGPVRGEPGNSLAWHDHKAIST